MRKRGFWITLGLLCGAVVLGPSLKPTLKVAAPGLYVPLRSAYWAIRNTASSTLGRMLRPMAERVELAYIRARYQGSAHRGSSGAPLPRLIAHAGGSIHGVVYSNSREALDASRRQGFRLVEVDFHWTTDGQLVCVHDWDTTIGALFRAPPRRYSQQEFKSLEMVAGLSQMALDDLAAWMRSIPDVRVVTDVKEGNVRALSEISRRYPDLRHRFIPQIFTLREYFEARRLHFDEIILTLYRYPYSDAAVLSFASRYPLTAVTMSIPRGHSDLPRRLAAYGVPSLVYVVNDSTLQRTLRANGVYGIYTDSIRPGP